MTKIYYKFFSKEYHLSEIWFFLIDVMQYINKNDVVQLKIKQRGISSGAISSLKIIKVICFKEYYTKTKSCVSIFF